jgi:hypothetical protein
MIGRRALVRTLSSIKSSKRVSVDACSIIDSGVVNTMRSAVGEVDCDVSDGERSRDFDCIRRNPNTGDDEIDETPFPGLDICRPGSSGETRGDMYDADVDSAVQVQSVDGPKRITNATQQVEKSDACRQLLGHIFN